MIYAVYTTRFHELQFWGALWGGTPDAPKSKIKIHKVTEMVVNVRDGAVVSHDVVLRDQGTLPLSQNQAQDSAVL